MTKHNIPGPTTRQGISAVLLLWAVIGLIIIIAAALVVLWNVTTTTAGGPELAHEPANDDALLETAPQAELQHYLAEKKALLDRYEWIDEAAGIAAIPLDMAIQSMLAPAVDDNDSIRSGPNKHSRGTAPIAIANALETAPTQPTTPTEFKQNLGTQLPGHLTFQDQNNRERHLKDFFDKTPIVLVLGYYHCPALCSTVMTSVLQTVQNVDVPYRVLAVSIDPRETPAIAARQYAFYRPQQTRGNTSVPRSFSVRRVPSNTQNTLGKNDLHLLTGQSDAIASLAQYAGFGWEYDEASDQYSHPAGFLVLTPAGKISRYFPGASFDQRDLRLALIEASDERVGSLAERIILMCSHYDPLKGRYSVTVMTLVRIASLTLLLTLGVIFWRLHRRRRL